MAVYKPPNSRNWYYKFMWRGESIRKSTRQTNKRIAPQMEAACKTALGREGGVESSSGDVRQR